MKKISTQAEIEMIEIELKQIMEEYGKDIDLNEIGLDIWSISEKTTRIYWLE